MAITPIDINSKDFDRKFKGYDPDQVDDFLDRITLEMESLIKEKRELEKKIKFMGEQVEHYMSLQDTLNKSIVVAQEAADRVKANAEKEAEFIINDANRRASDIVANATEKASVIRTETDILRKTATVFHKKFQILVESQLDMIKNQEWDSLLESTHESESTPMIDSIIGERATVSVDTVELNLDHDLDVDKNM